jgi:hypothetical protein
MTELYTRVYFFRNVQLIWNRVPVTGSISLSLSLSKICRMHCFSPLLALEKVQVIYAVCDTMISRNYNYEDRKPPPLCLESSNNCLATVFESRHLLCRANIC